MGEQHTSSASGAARRAARRRRVAEERDQLPELGLLNRLALAIADAPDLDAALGMVLSEVGQATGWDCGQAWVPTPDGAGLACRPMWYGDRQAFGRFRAVSEGTVFAQGVGLPGRAWAYRRPAWLRDLAADTNFPRWPVAQAVGLRTGMAIPVLTGREVAAVLEFFVTEERPEDEELVAFISAIGALLGSALARRRAEEALRESEERFRSVVESAIDAVVLADQAGTIVGWNAAAEEMFGYAEPEVLGRPLTLLMPPRFHAAHQAGLGRLARGGPAKLVGTVLEVVGRRQDGTEFPLELSLSTWTMASAACFSGILRDITERKRMEELLRDADGTESALRIALEQSELRVWYQPQVSLTDPGIVGAEALLRWQHPSRGLLSSAEFASVAEQTGLIVPIGNWVLGEACRQLAEWRSRWAPRLTVSVNVSAGQLAQPDLLRTVAGILAREALDPAALWLEIAEDVLMEDPESAFPLLTALKGLGIKLAIANRGTGRSSLSRLRHLPVDALKVDWSSPRRLGPDDGDTTTMRRLIQSARDLGLLVMAEGVETEDGLEELISLECDRAQGFYLAPPAGPDVFIRYLGGNET